MLEKGELNLEKIRRDLEASASNAEMVQRRTLAKILEQNGVAEYLRKHGLTGRTDPGSFKACVPLVTHEDLEPYIARIANGEQTPILTGKPIATLSLSSGTTGGKSKYIPFCEETMESTLQIYRTHFAFRNREYPIDDGKALQFIYSSKQSTTSGGILLGTATTNVFRNPSFKDAIKQLNSESSSPDEVVFGTDFDQSLYCHLLCGLIHRHEIQSVSSTFAHSIVGAFRRFETVWEELCDNIRTGELSTRVASPSIRSAVSKLLKPDPESADSIENKCRGLSNWYGLIPEIFPNVKYVYGILTGAMEPYLKKLRHYAGEVPLVSTDYGASEGWIGTNIHPEMPPELVSYAVLPDIGYFEFIPINDSVENRDTELSNPETLGLTEVKVGGEYEVVLTNFAGLYRYRLGDVVKVTSFFKSTPELKFMCRRDLIPSINIDKNTERDLQLVVEASSELLSEHKLELVDFSSFVDFSTEPGHYVIYWEMSGEAREEVLKECCNCLDSSFVDPGYLSSRKVGGIGKLELRVVRKGTFQKIMSNFVGKGGAASQFKTSRCVKPSNKIVLQILLSNVVKSYFSTAFD